MRKYIAPKMLNKMCAFLLTSPFVILIFAELTTSTSPEDYVKYKGIIKYLNVTASENPYFQITGKGDLANIVILKPLSAEMKQNLIASFVVDPDKPTAYELPSEKVLDVFHYKAVNRAYNLTSTITRMLIHKEDLLDKEGQQRVTTKVEDSFLMPETKSRQFKVKLQIADQDAKMKPYLTMFVNVKLGEPTTAAPTTTETTPPPTVPAGADVYSNGNITFLSATSVTKNPYLNIISDDIMTPETELNNSKISNMIVSFTIDPDKSTAQELPTEKLMDLLNDAQKYYEPHSLTTYVTYLMVPNKIYLDIGKSYRLLKNVKGNFYMSKKPESIPFLVKVELAEPESKLKPYVTMYAYVNGDPPAPTTTSISVAIETPSPTTEKTPVTVATPSPTTEKTPVTIVTPSPTIEKTPVTIVTPHPTTEKTPVTVVTPSPTTETTPVTIVTPSLTTEKTPVTIVTPSPTTEASTSPKTEYYSTTPSSIPSPTTEKIPFSIVTPSSTTEKIPVTDVTPTITTEQFTFSPTPATLGPADGVHAENCIWEPLRTRYQYIKVITNATWFDWYLTNCFPMHIGELLFFQSVSDNQYSKKAVPTTVSETEQGCYFLKYYNNGAYIKVVTNVTWFSWYINNCFPKYQGVYLPFQDSPTTERTSEVQATTPDSCILEEYFPDGNYVKVITNTTWFDWYMNHCYPKYIGKLLPLIPLKDYELFAPSTTTFSPPHLETTTVVNTIVQNTFCSQLNEYIRRQSFTTLTDSTWYPWYLYNCPETAYECC